MACLTLGKANAMLRIVAFTICLSMSLGLVIGLGVPRLQREQYERAHRHYEVYGGVTNFWQNDPFNNLCSNLSQLASRYSDDVLEAYLGRVCKDGMTQAEKDREIQN
jgi:arabinogalactan endo-1,4-beta-galactosidase